MSTRKYMVGRTVVFIDSHNNPYRFIDPAGNEVSCICQPGMRCAYHVRMMHTTPESPQEAT